jgi:hypothetical protein
MISIAAPLNYVEPQVNLAVREDYHGLHDLGDFADLTEEMIYGNEIVE